MTKTYDVHLVLSDDEDAMLKKLKKVYFQNSNNDDLTIHEIATLLSYAIRILNFHVQELEEALEEVKRRKEKTS
ncbi:hypothetical protein CVV65_07525 [Kyrpidia spormannii]|uniref:Uncharacterized protein n=1 Tax=Kyrpidia spormannii TaxID=2055160 RepID=A0A2K8N863_9BACL|nr:hypothetical protein [Kyrpidia spormannii]ATY84790.1 hypothetical protein CVV65_07525 [Kyrpidia spormannii]